MRTLSVLVGAAFLLLVGPLVGKFINRASSWAHVRAPAGVDEDEWCVALLGSGPGAAYIGCLESLLVYLAGVYATDDAALIIGGWFAFKVASKWEVWSNVIKMPDSFAPASSLESLRARRMLGYVMYDRLLIGTLVNVLSGVIVAGLVLKYGLGGRG